MCTNRLEEEMTGSSQIFGSQIKNVRNEGLGSLMAQTTPHVERMKIHLKELEQCEGTDCSAFAAVHVSQTSSQNCLVGCGQKASNKSQQGSGTGVSVDEGSDDDIDILGLNCDTGDGIASTASIHSSIKEIGNAGSEVHDEERASCTDFKSRGTLSGSNEGTSSYEKKTVETPLDSHRDSHDETTNSGTEGMTLPLSTTEQLSSSQKFNIASPLEELGDSEDDRYNRFYFESDHMALKGNKQ